MKFEQHFDERAPKITIEMHSGSTLTEVIESFRGFLVMCGYHPKSVDGHFDEQYFEEETDEI